MIIIGQGLAGTTLAWWLKWSGMRVLILDRDEPHTASKVAAGLITPLTGQRLTLSWRWEELWPFAVEFYRRAEQETGTEFFRERRMVRLLSSEEEQQRYETRLPEIEPFVSRTRPELRTAIFPRMQNSFEMQGGQLNVPVFLAASRKVFQLQNHYRIADVDWSQDAVFEETAVHLSRHNTTAKFLISCQGIAAAGVPEFSSVPFDPTKGEMLTVRIPEWSEERVIHSGLWLASLQDSLFQTGATYSWPPYEIGPTTAGREELCSRLKKWLSLQFLVVNHTAGVRPIIVGRHPVLGFHPHQSRLGFFNGLGSKGALQAPFFAHQLAMAIKENPPIDDTVDLQQRVKFPS